MVHEEAKSIARRGANLQSVEFFDYIDSVIQRFAIQWFSGEFVF